MLSSDEVHSVDCKRCGKTYEILLDKEDLRKWKEGEALIRNALTYLTFAQRELLADGICYSCSRSDGEESLVLTKEIVEKYVADEDQVIARYSCDLCCAWIAKNAEVCPKCKKPCQPCLEEHALSTLDGEGWFDFDEFTAIADEAVEELARYNSYTLKLGGIRVLEEGAVEKLCGRRGSLDLSGLVLPSPAVMEMLKEKEDE